MFVPSRCRAIRAGGGKFSRSVTKRALDLELVLGVLRPWWSASPGRRRDARHPRADQIGSTSDGREVCCSELWGRAALEIDGGALELGASQAGLPSLPYGPRTDRGTHAWRKLEGARGGALFPWEKASTYLRRPPLRDSDQARSQGPASMSLNPLSSSDDDVTTTYPPAGSHRRHVRRGWNVYLIGKPGGRSGRSQRVFAARRGNLGRQWSAGLFTKQNGRQTCLAAGFHPGKAHHPRALWTHCPWHYGEAFTADYAGGKERVVGRCGGPENAMACGSGSARLGGKRGSELAGGGFRPPFAAVSFRAPFIALQTS